jgi:membrane fusion protein, heavy metal efflux system
MRVRRTTVHTHLWQGLSAFALVSTIMLVLAGCEGSGSNTAADASNAKNSNNPELFTIPQDQMSHVQVLTVQPTKLTRSLRLTGAVAYNSFRTTPVITQVSGPVSRVVVVPGQKVNRGDPMLYVASPDYSQLRTNYLKAKDAYALAQKAYARAQDLYQHHAIAEQNLEQAQSAEVQAGGDLVAAQAALKVMGIVDPDALVKAPPSFEVPVKAPIGGLVVEQDIAAGQLIQPGTTQCFMISDVSTVWVLVNVYQKDLPYVHVGDQVTIQTDTYPEVFHGRIAYVAASLDPSTRTLQARIETNNPSEKLKKDMYVVATVNAGTIQNAIALPDAAVLRDSENQPFVYVEASSNQFGRRSVTLGESLNGQTEITSGLKTGDQVIGNGSLFLQFANSLQR